MIKRKYAKDPAVKHSTVWSHCTQTYNYVHSTSNQRGWAQGSRHNRPHKRPPAVGAVLTRHPMGGARSPGENCVRSASNIGVQRSPPRTRSRSRTGPKARSSEVGAAIELTRLPQRWLAQEYQVPTSTTRRSQEAVRTCHKTNTRW